MVGAGTASLFYNLPFQKVRAQSHKAGSNLNEKDIHHPVVQEHVSSKSEKEKKQVHELQEEANNKNFSSEISTLESDWLPYNPRGQRDIPRLDLLTLKNSSINGTQDQTTFEQPNFQNIISSTFINTHSISHQGKHTAVTVPVQHMSENINSGIFKVPRLLSNTLAVKNSTINLLSMTSIPEESSLLEATESEVPSQVCPSKENPLTNTPTIRLTTEFGSEKPVVSRNGRKSNFTTEYQQNIFVMTLFYCFILVFHVLLYFLCC
nr:uncharacterized protein LOC128690176 [Cherax quadricarinatus]